ncbi:MAG TPA: hypothetical protein VK698_02200 [Kofleriaceae bacterium]|nr:hypothetical protein [Kofleriaceae bacterium]
MSRLRSIEAVLIAAVASATWLAFPGPTDAKPGKSKPAMQEDLLPHDNVVPPKVLESDYARMRVTPYNDPTFYFELVVPRTFESQPVSVTRQELAHDNESPLPMGEFRPKNDATVLIEARYVRVPEKVTLDRFLAVYAEQSRFEIVTRQRGEYSGRKIAEALLRIESPTLGKTLTRVTVSRRGDLIFMVAGSTREKDYPKWKQAFAVAALSFDPKGK